jgi:hypothetical protein
MEAAPPQIVHSNRYNPHIRSLVPFPSKGGFHIGSAMRFPLKIRIKRASQSENSYLLLFCGSLLIPVLSKV